VDGVRAVQRFVEKPDAATAARYVADGYLWNSGNFMFRSDVLKAELSRHAPELMSAVSSAVAGTTADTLGFVRLGADAYGRSPRTSFDYAVMEKTDRAAVIEARFGWSDIGSWEAIYEIAPPDRANNALRGPVVAVAAENCLVHAEDRLTAVLGVKDLVIVSTADAVMVAPRGHAEDVKHLVATLKQAGHAEATNHRRVHRPWGYYESLDAGERFQVKRLVVAPKGKLSCRSICIGPNIGWWCAGRRKSPSAIRSAPYTRMSPSTSLSGRFIGSPIRARSPSSSWRCNRAVTLAKTISSVSMMSIVAIRSDPICLQAMNAQQWRCRPSLPFTPRSRIARSTLRRSPSMTPRSLRFWSTGLGGPRNQFGSRQIAQCTELFQPVRNLLHRAPTCLLVV
jgi:hypothetical protein